MMNRRKDSRIAPALSAFLAVLLVLVATAVGAADDKGAGEDAVAQPIPAVMAPLARYDLLLDVEKTGDGHYVAVGARGVIIRSSDGIHWEQMPSPVQAALTAVDFVDPRHGWAVGHAGVILATTDGGDTWTIQKWGPDVETEFMDVKFFNQNKGFAIGTFGLFYKTDDGGKTWTRYESRLTNRGWHLNGVVRLDNGTLVIAGETGLLSKSTDGGETWTLLDAPYSGTFFGLEQLGAKGIVLYGLRGHAFVIDDISTVATLPPDTDLMYDFKKPPTMEDESEKKTAEEEAKAVAQAEQQAIEKEVAQSRWQVVQNGGSILSLFGATETEDGGYVLVGRNGVIWASTDSGPDVVALPNPREGSLADVVATPDGNLVLVGKRGAFFYKRSN